MKQQQISLNEQDKPSVISVIRDSLLYFDVPDCLPDLVGSLKQSEEKQQKMLGSMVERKKRN